MDASAPPPRPQPRYSLSSYASTLPRRIQRTARGTTTPHAPFAERVARWVTVLLLLAAATFWVAYNIRRLTLALPVLQARVVSLGTVAVPGLIVCGGTFDRIGCAVGPTSGSPLGSKDCSDRVSMGGLSVQNYPELRTVFDPRWHCALVDTRGLNASAGADAASASLLPRGARIRRRQFIQSYPLDQPMFFDGNTTGRITLTVYSEALANGTARRPGGGTGSGPGTGPGSSIGSNWILLGRFVVPDSDDDDDMRRATLSAEFDWIEAPAVGSAVVSYSTFMSVRGERRDSLGWRINTQRAPSFPYDPTLLSILRIQPSLSPSFALNSSLPSLPYSSMITSEIWSFTFLDFLATSGGVLTASVFFYSLLWGQRRLDPWGMMQRVVFRSVPVALPLPEADEEKTGKRGCWSAWECGADKDERKGSGDSAANGDAVVVHAGDSPFELRSRTTSRETTVDLDLPPIPPPDPDPEPQTPTKMFRSPLSEHPSIEIPELPTPNSSSTFASTNPLLPSPPQTPLDERDARAALGDPLQSSESLRQDLHHRLLPLHLTNGTTTHGTVGSRTVDVDARVRGELLKFGELLGRYYLADVLDVRLAEGR